MTSKFANMSIEEMEAQLAARELAIKEMEAELAARELIADKLKKRIEQAAKKIALQSLDEVSNVIQQKYRSIQAELEQQVNHEHELLMSQKDKIDEEIKQNSPVWTLPILMLAVSNTPQKDMEKILSEETKTGSGDLLQDMGFSEAVIEYAQRWYLWTYRRHEVMSPEMTVPEWMHQCYKQDFVHA